MKLCGIMFGGERQGYNQMIKIKIIKDLNFLTSGNINIVLFLMNLSVSIY